MSRDLPDGPADDPFASFPAIRGLPGIPGPGASPAFDDEPTQPGARPRPAAPAQAAARAQRGRAARPENAGTAPLAVEAIMAGGLNPLVAAATPLLLCAPRIRASARQADPGALRQALAEGLRAFEAQARSRNLPNEQIVGARYVLCTMLDEAAAGTAWEAAGAWSAQSLLVQFHNETWGGEKVFRLLTRLAENVEANRRLLELLYLVLALGFQGRYRVLDDGRAQLEGLRDSLARLLRKGQPVNEESLSPRWRAEAPPAAPLRTGLPLWLLAAITALALLAVLAGLRAGLASRAEPIFETLAGLQPRPTTPAAPPAVPAGPAAVPARPLAGLLQPDIDAGRLMLASSADRTVLTIVGDRLFRSGQASVSPGFAPLLARIGAALATRAGQVHVTGHTDSQPIARAGFTSNQQLSQARAQAVRQALLPALGASRLTAEGLADSRPVADNRNPGGRARNRRVEITLLAPP